MSTTLMTFEERIASVRRLGYAQAEAQFPSLVALHGGYFARLQFDVWIGVERGKRSEEFLTDLLDHGHCRRDDFAQSRQVFHVRFTRPGAEELACCYVDSGFETSGPFATHLRRYLPLFTELGSFELVYVTTSATRLGQAPTVFKRALSKAHKWLTKVADSDRLIAHFRDRQLFEKQETSSFDRFRLDALRDDMRCFSGRHFAQRFACWKTSDDEVLRAEIAAHKMPNGRFSCLVLPHGLPQLLTRRSDIVNAWIRFDLVNAAKKARSPQFRWRRSPRTGFRAPLHGPSAPRRGGSTPVSGSREGRERPQFRSAAPPRTLPPSLSLRRGSLPPLPQGTTRAIRHANRIESCCKFERRSQAALYPKPSSHELDQNLIDHFWASHQREGRLL